MDLGLKCEDTWAWNSGLPRRKLTRSGCSGFFNGRLTRPQKTVGRRERVRERERQSEREREGERERQQWEKNLHPNPKPEIKSLGGISAATNPVKAEVILSPNLAAARELWVVFKNPKP